MKPTRACIHAQGSPWLGLQQLFHLHLISQASSLGESKATALKHTLQSRTVGSTSDTGSPAHPPLPAQPHPQTCTAQPQQQ